MEDNLKAQGITDIFKLADKDLIEKILELSKCIKIEHPVPNVTRIIIDVKTN